MWNISRSYLAVLKILTIKITYLFTYYGYKDFYKSCGGEVGWCVDCESDGPADLFPH